LTVHRLLAEGSLVNAADSDKRTPLHYGAISGIDDLVLALINNGANIEALDCWMEVPLHYAAATGNLNIVQILLSHGAQPNPISAHHMVPLHYGAISGSVPIVTFFLDRGVKVDTTGYAKRTAAKRVKDFGGSYVTNLVMNSGSQAGVNMLARDHQKFAENHWHSTALHYASELGHEDVVRLLLKRGADRYTKNKEGRTARQLAYKAGHQNIMEMCTPFLG